MKKIKDIELYWIEDSWFHIAQFEKLIPLKDTLCHLGFSKGNFFHETDRSWEDSDYSRIIISTKCSFELNDAQGHFAGPLYVFIDDIVRLVFPFGRGYLMVNTFIKNAFRIIPMIDLWRFLSLCENTSTPPPLVLIVLR